MVPQFGCNMTETSQKKFCVIVPGYREQCRIGKVVEGVRRYCRNVVVVDDGSPDDTAKEAEAAGAVVVKHATNLGKGVALNTGFKYARENGYEFLITMDGDGQHDPADIPGFVETYTKTGTPVLIGNRMDDPHTMPLVRRLTNQFMSWLLSRQMGQRVPDTQSGYRLFKCDVLADISVQSERFAAESEILLALSERGVKIGAVPIKIIYRDEKSKINPVRDTMRFIKMLNRRRG
jgi:glycosyltransferase involved in cell wall biosynthesis